MTHDCKASFRGAFFALIAFFIYSTHDVVVKFLGSKYHPVQIVFFSVCFGMPLATVMLMRDRTDGNLRPKHPWWTALRTLSTVITDLSAFYAFTVLPLAQTYAILFATPLLIIPLAIPILGEKVGIHLGGATGVMAVFSFVGMLLLIAAYRAGEAVIVATMQYSQIIWPPFRHGRVRRGAGPEHPHGCRSHHRVGLLYRPARG